MLRHELIWPDGRPNAPIIANQSQPPFRPIISPARIVTSKTRTPARVRLREAATTGEDARFWTHGGIDYQEVRHALGYRRARFAWDSARDRQELRRHLGSHLRDLPTRPDQRRR